jgi:hypothetical protein
MSVRISAEGLRRIPDQEIRKDFAFIVEGVQHRCCWHLAHFLSPKICELSTVDDTVCDFCIETVGANTIFDNILSIGRGDAFSIPESGASRRLYTAVFAELGNFEAISLINQHLNEDLSISNAIDRFVYCLDFQSPSEDRNHNRLG